MAWLRSGGRLWTHVAFLSRVAWPGAALGSVLAAILFAADIALPLRTGLGTSLDVLIGVVLAALAIGPVGLGVIVLRSVLRTWPALFAAGLLGPFAVLFVLLTVYFDAGVGVGLRFGGTLLLLSVALGGAVALIARRAPGMSRGRRTIGWLLLVVTIAGWIALAAWLGRPGTDPYAALQPPPNVSAVAALAAADPSATGRHAVRSLTYGSGTDRHRPEYGSGVSLRTETVDASPLVKRLTGFKARVRKWYWGFGADRFPSTGVSGTRRGSDRFHWSSWFMVTIRWSSTRIRATPIWASCSPAGASSWSPSTRTS